MEGGIRERVIAWARSGGNFHSGLSLFLSFNRNVFYVRNIEAKGLDRGMLTLVSEFSNKIKVPVAEIYEMIREGNDGRENPDQEIENSAPVYYPSVKSMNTSIITGDDDFQRDKKRVKLREEFPFLGAKDCPSEFALVVYKMLTAHDNYRIGREKLYDLDSNDPEKCYQAAREALDAYILNRECWEELNYYKLHGKVKGSMPELAKAGMIQDYNAMNTGALIRMMNNSIPRRMSYYKKQINDPLTKNRDDIRGKKAAAEAEIEVIRNILQSRGEI